MGNMEDNRDVFISYHTSSSAETLRKIADALEGAGISCWFAPRDCGEQFAGSIVAAIRRCRIFLLLLNEHSNASAHVLNEVNCAFERLKNHEEITLLPFRLDEAPLSDDVYYYLGRIHMMDGVMPPEELRIRELVDRIMTILDRRPVREMRQSTAVPAGDLRQLPLATSDEASQSPAGIGDQMGVPHRESPRRTDTADQAMPPAVQPAPILSYALVGTLVYPDKKFIGREAELASIEAALRSTENVLFLVGMGGIGKSEIAKMYIKQHAADYDVVLWADFAGSLEHTVASDDAFPIRGLSHSDYTGEDERTYFLRKLRVLKELSDRRILLVIDNFDVEEDPDLDLFCGGAYSILFTTRNHDIAGNLPEVEVLPMTDPAELMQLFRAEYNRPLMAEGRQAAEEIIRLLDCHTLSIRLVASAMQSRRITPERMLALLREGHQGLEKENAKAVDLIFGRLRRVFGLSTLTAEELYLLKNLSLIPLRGIEVETLFAWCGAEEYEVIDSLIRRSWVIHDPVTDEVHLHPLVADLMREELQKDPACCTALLDGMREAGKAGYRNTYAYKQKILEYLQTAYDRLPADHPQHFPLLRAMADAVMDMSFYAVCSSMYREIWEHAPTLTERLGGCAKLAHCLTLGGYHREAYETALAGWEEIAPQSDDALEPELGYHMGQLLARISESAENLGDLETGLQYAFLALEKGGKYYNTSRQESEGWKRWHIAAILRKMGRLPESRQYLDEAEALFQETDDQWSLAFVSELRGQLLADLDEFAEALDCSVRAHDILLPLLGEEHRDMAQNLEWRGDIYTAAGDRAQAEACYRGAADIYRRSGSDEKARILEERTGLTQG